MGDKRIPISEANRDALKARKRGDETYDDVIERLLADGEGNAFDTTAQVSVELDDESVAELRDEVEAAVGEGADVDALADAVAERVTGTSINPDLLADAVDVPDTVSLEASERRAIAQEFAEVLGR